MNLDVTTKADEVYDTTGLKNSYCTALPAELGICMGRKSCDLWSILSIAAEMVSTLGQAVFLLHWLYSSNSRKFLFHFTCYFLFNFMLRSSSLLSFTLCLKLVSLSKFLPQHILLPSFRSVFCKCLSARRQEAHSNHVTFAGL